MSTPPTPPQEIPSHPSTGDSAQPKRHGIIRRGASTLIALKTWKTQASILKDRASFPLLRQVLKREKSEAERIVDWSEISDQTLSKALLSHLVLLIVLVPVAIWAAFITTKGIALGVRFDTWFNAWLLQGPPLLVFALAKSLVSNHSRILIQRELAKRNQLDKSGKVAP